MFDWVHNNKRLIQIILGLLIVPFAFFGIESYQNLRSRDVATVDGQPISEQEFSRELQQQQDRLRSMLGANFDPEMMDTTEMRTELLESMIAQRLLVQEAVRRNMSVSDEEVREVISSLPIFQQDGKFSLAQYEAYLRSRSQSPAMFENSLRRDLLLQQLSGAIGDSGIVSRTIAGKVTAFRSQEREIAEHLVRGAQFAGDIKPAPEAVQAFYEANKRKFETPEQVRVEYVVLSSEALAAGESIPAQDVKAFYEQNMARYGTPEQRQASHILIAFKPDASAEDKAKTREKASQIAEQARKSPGSFAELAKKNSDDPGSAAKGGDLGYFSRGMMVKPFEDAVFSMKSGEISAPVESEFGYHIIRLTGVRPSSAKPLEQVRGEIEAELRKQVAGRRFAQAADTFSNLVYEQSGSLKPAADQFKLTVQQAGWMTRDKASAAPLQHPKLAAALFSEDATKNRHNTEAVEVSPGTLVAARVVEHKPAALRPLEEVQAEVRKQLIEKESLERARKEGEARLAALKKGEVAGAKFGPTRTVSRQKPQGVQPQALAPLFRADASKLPAFVGVELPDGYGIYRISKVVTPEPSEEEVKKLQAELGRFVGAQQFRAYLAALRASGDVSINKDVLQKKQ